MSLITKKIAIIGGGISGLALAYRLEQIAKQKNKQVEIHLFEKSSHTGGTIQTKHQDGFILEKGPDGFLQQKSVVRDLAKELGIENELISTKPTNRRSMILQKGQLIEVPDGFYLMSPAKIIPFLKSPLLSWRGKIRTLLEPFIPAKKNDAEESLADFVRRRFGKENLEKISQAMLGGIYTADPEHLSMQAALPRFTEMEKQHGSILKGVIASMAQTKDISGPRYGLFGSFHEGMSRLTDALTSRIPVDHLHLNTQVQGITYDSISKNWKLSTNNQDYTFDEVCLTVPSHIASSIITNLTQAQRHAFKNIPYASSAILHFGFKNDQIKNRPSAIGFIVPHKENKHFIACSFMSNKYDHRAPEGFDLIRVFAGGALQEEVLQWPLDKLRSTILEELSNILKIDGNPIIEDIAVWPNSMPQYTLGHMDRVEKMKGIISEYPNLHFTGNAFGGVGIPDLIGKANVLADNIIN